MKLLPVLLIAIFANFLSAYLLWYFDNCLSTEYTHIGDIMQNVLWAVSMIGGTTIMILRRKDLFKGLMTFWTVLIFLFCTPFPFVTVVILLNH